MDARFIAKNVFNHWAARDEELVQLCANVMADEAIPLDKKPGHISHLFWRVMNTAVMRVDS
jgi:hypothetical protein